MQNSIFSIFKVFFKVGLLQSELVEKKGWITSEELCEYYALSTSLPGIIAVNTAIFTGRKLAGSKGAFVSVMGVIMPAFLAIILLASLFEEIVYMKSVQNIFWGVGIGVITLLFLAIKEMWGKCVTDKFSTIIYILCLILALFTKISPALIVILALLIGIISQKIKNERMKKYD